jgi:hypothetical protein
MGSKLNRLQQCKGNWHHPTVPLGLPLVIFLAYQQPAVFFLGGGGGGGGDGGGGIISADLPTQSCEAMKYRPW